MQYLEVVVHEQQEDGIRALDMRINPANVMAIIKPPLQPSVICCFGANLMTKTELPDEVPGLIKVETKEHGTAYLNPDFVSFYYSSELGTYTVIFPGGTQVAVRETAAGMKTLLEGSPALDIDLPFA